MSSAAHPQRPLKFSILSHRKSLASRHPPPSSATPLPSTTVPEPINPLNAGIFPATAKPYCSVSCLVARRGVHQPVLGQVIPRMDIVLNVNLLVAC